MHRNRGVVVVIKGVVVCAAMSQCVTVCYSVLQCVAGCLSKCTSTKRLWALRVWSFAHLFVETCCQWGCIRLVVVRS